MKLNKLLEYRAELNQLSDQDDLLLLIENAENWQAELVGLNYFLSQILEVKAKTGINCKKILGLYYQLSEQMWFSTQEIDATFVEYILAYQRNSSLSLAENLIEVQNNLSEYKYGSTFRY